MEDRSAVTPHRGGSLPGARAGIHRLASAVSSRGRSAILESVTDQPEVRIGTTERERAHNALSEHFSAGRLDINEFEERSGLTAAARTSSDLARLFSDLPGGLPGALTAPRLGPHPAAPGRSLIRSVGPPVMVAAVMVLIAVGLFTGHGWVLVLLFPVFRGVHHRRWTNSGHHLDGPGLHQR